MTETIGITTVISEVGWEGILRSLGGSLFQLALIVVCVIIIRKILKKQDASKNKGAGLRIGWSVDEEEECKRYGVEEEKENKEE